MKATANQQPSGTRTSSKPVVVETVNYYKQLGVRVNATPKSIEAGYEAKIKEFPQEQYPEEFRKIREAYDNLSDPIRRDEYDFTRKNGSTQKLDTLIDKGTDAFAEGDFRLAEELYRKVLELKPDHSGASIALSSVYLAEDKLSMFDEVWKKVEALSPSTRSSVIGTMLQIRVLLQYERYEKALSVARALDKKHRAWRRVYLTDYTDVLMMNQLGDEAWGIYEEMAGELKEGLNEDLNENNDVELKGDTLQFYFYWIKIMVYTNKMQFWHKVKQEIRAYLRSLPEGAERESAVERLLEESRELAENRAYKEALLFAELAHYIDPGNPAVQQQRTLAQGGNKLLLETDRLIKDKSMYPGVQAKANDFFTSEGYRHPAERLDQAPPDGMWPSGGAEHGDYFMTEGIRIMKRKYPHVYKSHQELWDKLMS
ncbi:DnaJ domain-containing protein [Paenibacillus sp. FSL R7-0312]|uniref:J domain-containing protein n=1 Tax=Paenibacillus sp. FSL R7-0312 TaxID=2921682 RepID=UPI0030F51814